LARAQTAVDLIAERYLDVFAALDPCAATELGIVGTDTNYDEDLTDYSPAGVAARADAARATLRELDTAEAPMTPTVSQSRRCGNVSVSPSNATTPPWISVS
jgi:hypothetical protein